MQTGPYRAASDDGFGVEHYRVGASGLVLVDAGLDKVDGEREVLRAREEAHVLYGVAMVLAPVAAEVVKSDDGDGLREGDMGPVSFPEAWQVHTAASVVERWPVRLPPRWLSSLAELARPSSAGDGSTVGRMEWRVGPRGLARVRWPIGQLGRDRKIHHGKGEVPVIHGVDLLIEALVEDEATRVREDGSTYGGGKVGDLRLVDGARNWCKCTTAAVQERWPTVLDRDWVRRLVDAARARGR